LRTMYEPRSTVVHAGTVSTDNITRDRLIERNRRLLVRRWGERLADRPPLIELTERPGRFLALRDAPTPDRVLILRDDDADGAKLVRAAARRMASGWPDARVTLVGAERDGALEELLGSGVEVVNPPDLGEWLESRRFHYSVILGADRALDGVLERTQPQAERKGIQEALALPIEGLMASIGAGPPLD
ncbi:MAG: glycosyltransferase family 2 protein, partial [Candidatus Limnocylindria bacterium]